MENEKLKLTSILDAQNKISNINKVIDRLSEKISQLNYIKDKGTFIIGEERTEERNDYCYRHLTYASLLERRSIIKEIYLYNYPYKVDVKDYIIEIFGNNSDIFYGKTILVKKDDPLWDILILKHIKKLEELVETNKNKIEKIKSELKEEEHEFMKTKDNIKEN